MYIFSSNIESDDLVQSKTDNIESRKSKNTSHVDVHFQVNINRKVVMRKLNVVTICLYFLEKQDSTCNFTCKVYYAKEFDNLRCNLLEAPNATLDSRNPKAKCKIPTDTRALEEETNQIRKMFTRSLCQSVVWEARGGKSGSKFSKTIDDRFVLKEMSNKDISIFEDFAPNYFEYLSQCLVKEQPTLLAKIFGVFKVTIRKKE